MTIKGRKGNQEIIMTLTSSPNLTLTQRECKEEAKLQLNPLIKEETSTTQRNSEMTMKWKAMDSLERNLIPMAESMLNPWMMLVTTENLTDLLLMDRKLSNLIKEATEMATMTRNLKRRDLTTPTKMARESNSTLLELMNDHPFCNFPLYPDSVTLIS